MSTVVAVEYEDNTLMPFGKFKGDKLVNVPAWYLLNLWDEKRPLSDPKLEEYIKDNLTGLRKEK